MVQEEMSVNVVGDSGSSADIPDVDPCRILPFDENESVTSIDDRIMHLIYLLDK
jgi:hypothetical protein